MSPPHQQRAVSWRQDRGELISPHQPIQAKAPKREKRRRGSDAESDFTCRDDLLIVGQVHLLLHGLALLSHILLRIILLLWIFLEVFFLVQIVHAFVLVDQLLRRHLVRGNR